MAFGQNVKVFEQYYNLTFYAKKNNNSYKIIII